MLRALTRAVRQLPFCRHTPKTSPSSSFQELQSKAEQYDFFFLYLGLWFFAVGAEDADAGQSCLWDPRQC